MSLLKHYVRINFLSLRRYSSALYITGDKATTNYSLLTPHIDIEERIQNINELQENIKLRQLNINLDKILNNWQFYKHLLEDLTVLDVTRESIYHDLAELKNKNDKNDQEFNNLQMHAHLVKTNYKNLRDFIYPVEETAALDALSLPNVLDRRTPHENEELLHSFHDIPSNRKSGHHFELANIQNFIHYLNPSFAFLKNEAAEFEYKITNYCRDILMKNSFISFVNPSFARSVIVEGCCTDLYDNQSLFTISEAEAKYSLNKLHFVGGATLYSFMAYFARFSIQTGYFPVKLFSVGKQYSPVSIQDKNFFNLNQYSAVEVFTATSDDDITYSQAFNALVTIAKQFYHSLGYHYKMVYLPANKLKNYDSLRISIQMYSCHLQTYVEIGSLSLSNIYLSKRLLVTYKDGKSTKYSRIISGTVLNVQKLLACILEYNDSSKMNLKDLLQKIDT